MPSSRQRRPPRRRGTRRRAPRPAAPVNTGKRIRLLAALMVGGLLFLGARAVFLGTVRAGDLSEQALEQHKRAFEVPAPRGTITSRDGQVLATDRLAVDISATPFLIDDPVGVAEPVARALDIDAAKLADRISGNAGFAPVAYEVDPELADKVKALEIPGLAFTDTYQRYLPRGKAGAQVIGLTGRDGEGLSGVEALLDDRLKGTSGKRVEAQDPFGRPLDVISNSDPRPGLSARLTIDATVQEHTERVLARVWKATGAESATAVVMRPADGAILAMATVPRFDPNKRETVPEDLARNRPVTDAVDPGSTFKIVTVAGALQEGVVGPSTVFNLPASLSIYDRTLGEAKRSEAVRWDVTEIIQHSSNVGTTLIAQKFGAARVQSWVERFGFGRETGIDFPGESAGLMRPLDQWSGVSIANIPIGQGISTTLIQMARAYAAVANRGFLVEPHLVGRVGADPPVEHPRKRILTNRTARQVDAMLRRVVSEEGTGPLAAVPGYEVAGKTGTANKINPDTGSYDGGGHVASFIGYAPAGKPQLLVAVEVDGPTSGAYYGGEVAAPVFREIAEFALAYLEIAP